MSLTAGHIFLAMVQTLSGESPSSWAYKILGTTWQVCSGKEALEVLSWLLTLNLTTTCGAKYNINQPVGLTFCVAAMEYKFVWKKKNNTKVNFKKENAIIFSLRQKHRTESWESFQLKGKQLTLHCPHCLSTPGFQNSYHGPWMNTEVQMMTHWLKERSRTGVEIHFFASQIWCLVIS